MAAYRMARRRQKRIDSGRLVARHGSGDVRPRVGTWTGWRWSEGVAAPTGVWRNLPARPHDGPCRGPGRQGRARTDPPTSSATSSFRGQCGVEFQTFADGYAK